jgi:hypothetical protein
MYQFFDLFKYVKFSCVSGHQVCQDIMCVRTSCVSGHHVMTWHTWKLDILEKIKKLIHVTQGWKMLVKLATTKTFLTWFVCLFVCVAALPLRSKQGASEVKAICLRPALELKITDGTATSRLRSCVLVHQWFWPKRQSSGVLQPVRLHWK